MFPNSSFSSETAVSSTFGGGVVGVTGTGIVSLVPSGLVTLTAVTVLTSTEVLVFSAPEAVVLVWLTTTTTAGAVVSLLAPEVLRAGTAIT